jgi:hypothetical protein
MKWLHDLDEIDKFILICIVGIVALVFIFSMHTITHHTTLTELAKNPESLKLYLESDRSCK